MSKKYQSIPASPKFITSQKDAQECEVAHPEHNSQTSSRSYRCMSSQTYKCLYLRTKPPAGCCQRQFFVNFLPSSQCFPCLFTLPNQCRNASKLHTDML
eukprot:1154476-Pelagomonas_calceolata.AAC.5